ncbi:MAG: [protein-PII] uridylyltransferase, partial [Pseudomonadota bacterium]
MSAPAVKSDTLRFDDLKSLSLDDTSRTAFYKSILEVGFQKIREHYPDGSSTADSIASRSNFIDQVLQHCWHSIVDSKELALVAVGGYGRAELHPYSDLDVMVLTPATLPSDTKTQIQEFVTQLWDTGLQIGHSVRSIEQCVEESVRDVTVVTNLIEARLIEGPHQLFSDMRAAISQDNIWPADEFYRAKREEQKIRHARYQDNTYRLEPNVKESPGGIRDIQTIRWIALRLFNTGSFDALLEQGFLDSDELLTLTEGEALLARIRSTLHNIAGRHEDRLLFDHQREMAHTFGYTNDENNLCIEQFMQSYYRTVTTLERLNEILLQQFAEVFNDTINKVDPTPISTSFQLVDNYIEVVDGDLFQKNPSALLEIFLEISRRSEIVGIAAGTIRLIRQHLYLIDDNFRNESVCQQLFIEILRQPQGVTHQLRRMNRYGVLAAYLPIFEKIVGRMQYDLFHIYTVDEHTLMVIRNMRRYFIQKHKEELPHCFEVAKNIAKPELLYLMGLFHDIAKGRGGDHSELGAQDAREFGALHKLGAVDSGLLAWAVENHLLMSMTMQRRDISDPDVVYAFAERVSSKTHLDHLYLLTVADIRGTNPELWNSWKDSLLRTLYESTLRVLNRGLDNPHNRNDIIEENKQDALQRLLARQLESEAVEK